MTTTTKPARPQGSGRLRERRPGVWEGSIRVGGKHLSKTFHAKGKREANELMKAWVAAVPAAPAHGTFAQVLSDWLDLAAESVEASTFRNYKDLADEVSEALGDLTLGELRPHVFGTYYRSLSTASKAQKRHAVIRMALNHAVFMELLPANPVAQVKPPAHRKPEIRVPDADIAQALADAAFAANVMRGVLVFTAMSTGLRRGEICGLQWKNLDLKAGTLRAEVSVADVRGQCFTKDTKSHQGRLIPLDPTSVQMLQRVRDDAQARAKKHGAIIHADGFVFSEAADCSTFIRPDTVTRWWAKVRATVEGAEGVRFHALRHLMATRWLNEGVPLPVVSERLGHAQQSTTLNMYAHAVKGAQADAAAAMAAGLPTIGIAKAS